MPLVVPNDHQLRMIQQVLEVVFAQFVDAASVVMRDEFAPGNAVGRLVREGLEQLDFFPSVVEFDQLVADLI